MVRERPDPERVERGALEIEPEDGRVDLGEVNDRAGEPLEREEPTEGDAPRGRE